FATMHLWVPGLYVWPLTDIGGGFFSLATLAVFLKFVWKPRTEWRFPDAPGANGGAQTTGPAEPHDPQVDHAKEEAKLLLDSSFRNPHAEIPLTARSVIVAWSPFLVMAVFLAGAGLVRGQETKEKRALEVGPLQTYYEQPVPTLHKQVERADRLLPPGAVGEARTETAVVKFPWVTAPGTPVFLAALASMAFLRMNRRQVANVFRKTAVQMKVPIPTIAMMLGLSYVTKYAGIDATLGVAFAETGALYPFFAAMLGWLGVFLTGTDAGSNALFGSLQKITATEVWNAHHNGALSHLTLEEAQVLICTANSTGGVMGKMIDAQSICVATAGTNQIGKEADLFKAVIWHSIFLACVVGALTALQAFVPPFTHMVPRP
ncbi:MAG TPA: L-lactate permease, partial [Urbifossiella sp.]|nr:L-lactate permease [Urbifossiella sp.]